MNRVIPLALAVAVAGGLGLWIGQSSKSGPSSDAGSSSEAPRGPRQSAAHVEPPETESTPTRRSVAELRQALEAAFGTPVKGKRISVHPPGEAGAYRFLRGLEPEEAASLVLIAGELPQALRDVVLRAGLWRWAEGDTKAALQFITTNASRPAFSGIEGFVPAIVARWARADFDLALQYTLADGNAARRNSTLRELGEQLAHRDPQRAMALAKQFPDVAAGPFFAWNVAQSWPQGERDGLIDALCRLGPPDDLDPHVRKLIRQAATTRIANPMTALEWARGLAHPEARLAAERSVMKAWTARQPAEAAAHVLATRPGLDTVEAVARTYGSNDPIEAAEWAARLPDERTRAAANEAIRKAEERTRADEIAAIKAAAREHVSTLLSNALSEPTSDARDRAIADMMARPDCDPAACSTRVTHIGSKEHRQRAAHAIFTRWKTSDPTKATEWLENTSALSPAQKSLILRSQTP